MRFGSRTPKIQLYNLTHSLNHSLSLSYFLVACIVLSNNNLLVSYTLPYQVEVQASDQLPLSSNSELKVTLVEPTIKEKVRVFVLFVCLLTVFQYFIIAQSNSVAYSFHFLTSFFRVLYRLTNTTTSSGK